MSNNFPRRIKESAQEHESVIVLALDINYTNRDSAIIFAKNSINLLQKHICAVKIFILSYL